MPPNMKLVLILSILLLKYTTISVYVCVPLEIMNNNPVSETPIGKIVVNDSSADCQLYLEKYNTSKELYEMSLIDPWVNNHKHLFYKHLRLSYPNYDIPVKNSTEFKIFTIEDSIHLISPLKISSEDVYRILQQSNCSIDYDVDVHFHENYISHRPDHRL